jgi:hypothetical protein
MTLTWDAVAGASSYNLYWRTTTGVTKWNGTKIAGVTNPYNQTGLTPGTTYYYVLTAVTSGVESADSNEANAAALSSFLGPTSVAGLLAWYKGDGIVGYLDGDYLNSWVDSSGGGNLLDSTGFGTERPLYQTNELNGLPVVEFQGFFGGSHASWMRMAWPTPSNHMANACATVFTVTKWDDVSVPYAGLLADGWNDTWDWDGGAAGIWYSANNPAKILASASWQDGTSTAFLSMTRITTQYQIISIVTPGPTYGTINQIGFPGKSSRGMSKAFDGKVAEIIVYSTEVGTTDRQKLEGWLACKYNLQSILPGGHPYKVSCP